MIRFDAAIKLGAFAYEAAFESRRERLAVRPIRLGQDRHSRLARRPAAAGPRRDHRR